MKKYLLFILALIMVFQVACTNASNEEIVEVEEPDDISIQVAAEDRIIIERSEDLADYVVELFGIDDAAAIIFNDTALICVVMAYDTGLTQETRDLINSIVLEKDKALQEVIVSDDEKSFYQVVEVISSLMNGSPYDKHVSEISKLIDKNK